jgi:hypothetical protein
MRGALEYQPKNHAGANGRFSCRSTTKELRTYSLECTATRSGSAVSSCLITVLR